MSDIILNAKVRNKYDSAARWTSNNPILLKGQLGIESDTGKIKIGNGIAAWNSLSYNEKYTTTEKTKLSKLSTYDSITPTLYGLTGVEYEVQKGTYFKDGNMIHCQFYIKADMTSVTKNSSMIAISLGTAPVKSINDDSFMGNFNISGFGNINTAIIGLMAQNSRVISLATKAINGSLDIPEYYTNINTEDIESTVIELWGSVSYICVL